MKNITLEKFLDYRFLGNLQASLDETRFAFLSAVAKREKNEYRHTLHLGDKKGLGKTLPLGKNNDYLFLDEKRILLNLQKTKKEEKALKEEFRQSYHLFDLDKGKTEKAFTLPFPAKLERTIDADTILFSTLMEATDHILYEGDKEKRETHVKEKKKLRAFEDIEEIPYYFDGMDFIANKHKQLFLYDISAEKVKRVLPKDFSVESFTLSKDKKTIYYTGKKKERIRSLTSRIFAYDTETGDHTVLYDKKDHSVMALAEVDRELLVVARDMAEHGINENPDFFLLKDGQLELLCEFGGAFGNTVGTDCRLLPSEKTFVKDGRYHFITTVDDHTEWKAIGLDGKMETILVMDGSIDGITPFGGEIRLIGMKGTRLQEVYAYDFRSTQLSMLTRKNTNVLQDHYVAKPQPLVLQREDHEVKGFVLLPKSYDPAKKYPAVLNIHGGPKTVYGSIFYHEMQYWANEGFFVFFANPKGSDGKGDAFADIRGKYGTIDYEDLMDFTDKVLAEYQAIDETRLFVTGGSYGGFMTNWIITHTDRFRAAVTQRSISNWLSFYGTSDIGIMFGTDQVQGHPLRDREKLYEQSPIKYALNVKTPLLFIHADKDHRCPIEQAQQFHAVLQAEGVETKLVWVKDESHGLSRGGKPEARIKRLQEITGWFKDHM